MLSIKAALMKNNNKYRCDKIDRNYIYENYLPTFIVIQFNFFFFIKAALMKNNNK